MWVAVVPRVKDNQGNAPAPAAIKEVGRVRTLPAGAPRPAMLAAGIAGLGAGLGVSVAGVQEVQEEALACIAKW